MSVSASACVAVRFMKESNKSKTFSKMQQNQLKSAIDVVQKRLASDRMQKLIKSAKKESKIKKNEVESNMISELPKIYQG